MPFVCIPVASEHERRCQWVFNPATAATSTVIVCVTVFTQHLPVTLGGRLPSGRLGMRFCVSRGKLGSKEGLNMTSGTLKRSGPMEISVPSGSCKGRTKWDHDDDDDDDEQDFRHLKRSGPMEISVPSGSCSGKDRAKMMK